MPARTQRQILQDANKRLDVAIRATKKRQEKEKEKRQLDALSQLPGQIVDGIEPVMQNFIVSMVGTITKAMQSTAEEIRNITVATPNVNVSPAEIPKIEVPKAQIDVKIPEINVPKPEVTVNVPPIKIPKIIAPEVKIPTINVPTPELTVDFPNYMRTILDETDMKHPLPVILTDGTGKPYTAMGGQSAKVPSVFTLKPLGGPDSDGTVALVSDGNWYAVPPLGSIPTKPYTLVVSKENFSGTVRFSFNGGGSASATNGNRIPDHLAIDLAGGSNIYCGSSTAGDDVNWTTKETNP